VRVVTNSLDNSKVIALLCNDVHTLLPGVFTPRSLKLTQRKLISRCEREGIGFLMKTLPRLGRSLDRALTGEVPLDSLNFQKKFESQLPKLFGELFERIFAHNGWILPDPCKHSVKLLRQLLFVYYKYETPYDKSLENEKIFSFIKTEEEISSWSSDSLPTQVKVQARKLIARVLANFNPLDICPKHGPGVVSTKETFHQKFMFRRNIPRLHATFPWDQYFTASFGHVCDQWRNLQDYPVVDDLKAKIILVPKDSRGPRIISCEPLENQWIQQGIMRSLVQHIETHPLTRGRVLFTDQEPNRQAALAGSLDGNLVTLDLKEASDRVSAELVRLIWPENLLEALFACRSDATTLPNGSVLRMKKFAPMGSALCFPVMALTIFALASAVMSDADLSRGLLVYGDDVIIPRDKTQNVITVLEQAGLLVNRDKSCISGFFRESCGLDAFAGVDVTPVRLRTVWSSSHSAGVYTSYIAYANELYKRGFYTTAMEIAGKLVSVYRQIPVDDTGLYPALVFEPPGNSATPVRVNSNLQKLEKRVRVSEPLKENQDADNWEGVLRYFTESHDRKSDPWVNSREIIRWSELAKETSRSSQAGLYTHRRRSKLRWRWR
jgi:hypothetical protein